MRRMSDNMSFSLLMHLDNSSQTPEELATIEEEEEEEEKKNRGGVVVRLLLVPFLISMKCIDSGRSDEYL
jgi:hypothetical protein